MMNLAQDIRDAYHALDVMPGADLDEVKAAYRRQARALHPDLNPGRPDRDMAQVNRAYQRLCDFLASQPQAGGYRPYDFETWAPRRGQRAYEFEAFGQGRPQAAPKTSAKASPKAGVKSNTKASTQTAEPPRAQAAGPARPRTQAASPRPVPRTAPPAAAPAGLQPTALGPLGSLEDQAGPASPRATWSQAGRRPAASASPTEDWRLLGLRQQGPDLVYQVRLQGRPHSLSLPVRSRRQCPHCQGKGHLQDRQGWHLCQACAGRGSLTQSRMVELDLPRDWRHGQVLPLMAADGPGSILVELLASGGEV